MNKLESLLHLERKTKIVDVGAAKSGDEPIYWAMLQAGQCHLIGFEPDDGARLELQTRATENEVYLNHVIGDGMGAVFHICAHPAMSSLLAPNEEALKVFGALATMGKVVSTHPVMTSDLDSVIEGHVDFLKLDIQGAELMALDGATRHLRECVAVQVEVAFTPIYHGQPGLGEIDRDLRVRGFIPYRVKSMNGAKVEPGNASVNCVVDADFIYLKDLANLAAMSSSQLKHLAMVAHWCLLDRNIALRCIHELARRGDVERVAPEVYLLTV